MTEKKIEREVLRMIDKCAYKIQYFENLKNCEKLVRILKEHKNELERLIEII